VFGPKPAELDVFVVDVTGGLHATEITADLRAAGMAADRGYDNRSMKAQMKLANRSGAQFAVIIGDDEVSAGTAVVKPLRIDDEQITIARSDLIAHFSQDTTTGTDPS
jgi:histidyl-tRNA synthetase